MAKLLSTCKHCGKEFEHWKYKNRSFFSIKCYIKFSKQKRLRFKYFDKYVVRTSEGCWKWTGRVNIGGYPQLADNYPAHKFSYEYYVKPIPKGLYALHHCDTRSCCNFSHIFLGTLNDNNQDMIKKGRMYINYGGKSPKRKLSARSCIEIKKLLKTGLSQNKISKKFNISQSGIVDIKSGRTYKNVKDAE